ncbi:hypothetical protein STEG23_000932, partial [Scotinomys teguina]
MIEILTVEMDKPFKEIEEKINKNLRKWINPLKKAKNKQTKKQVKEMNKTVEDLKIETEAIKKTQTEGILEMENLGVVMRMMAMSTFIILLTQEYDSVCKAFSNKQIGEKSCPGELCFKNFAKQYRVMHMGNYTGCKPQTIGQSSHENIALFAKTRAYIRKNVRSRLKILSRQNVSKEVHSNIETALPVKAIAAKPDNLRRVYTDGINWISPYLYFVM